MPPGFEFDRQNPFASRNPKGLGLALSLPKIYNRFHPDEPLGVESIKDRLVQAASKAPCIHEGEHPMLVLSRKVGERVVIGENIFVTVLEVKGRQVRLGFEAPPEIQIWRGEISFDNHAPTGEDEKHLVTASR
jgi:carbon storage regulator CsrA